MPSRVKRRVEPLSKEPQHSYDDTNVHMRRIRKSKIYSNDGRKLVNQATRSKSYKPDKRNILPPLPAIRITLCKYWSSQGQCRNYPNCKFQHNLRIVSQIPRAHDNGIYSVTSFPSTLSESESFKLGFSQPTSVIEIFTGSRDKTVKRWIMYPKKNSHPEKMEIELQKTYKLSASCLSIYAGQGCLVCGLSNGIIYVVDLASNHSFKLTSHKEEVHCVKIIQNVLVSADWSGSLKFWKPEINQKIFIETASIELNSPITAFIEVTTPAARQLWVGCTGGIKVVDLTSLTICKEIKIANAPNHQEPVVMELLFVEQHVICSLLEGRIIVYNVLDGSEVVMDKTKYMTDSRGSKICSMAGSSSLDGPVLICGRPYGFISIISLPSFEEKQLIKHHSKDVRVVHNIGGHPSYFITASFDGTRSIFANEIF